MLSLKEYISIDEAWSKTIAKNRKDFTVHINTEINSESTYYFYYLYGKTWYPKPKYGVQTVKGSDLVKTIKKKNEDLFPTIQPLDIYINPAGISNEKLDGVIVAPLTVNHIVWKAYFLVEVNKLSTKVSEEENTAIYNLLVPGEYADVNALIQKALIYIKERQGIFSSYSSAAADTGWDIQNTLIEDADPIEYLEGDEVMRKLFTLVVSNVESARSGSWYYTQRGGYVPERTLNYLRGLGVDIPDSIKQKIFGTKEEVYKVKADILEILIKLPRDIQHEILDELTKRQYHNLIISNKISKEDGNMKWYFDNNPNYKYFSQIAAEVKEKMTLKKAYNIPGLDWDIGNTI